MADNLGVKVGDKVTLIVPKISLTPAGMIPRIKQFRVSGIFSVSYQYDAYYAMINIKDAQKVFETGNSVSSLQLSVKISMMHHLLKTNSMMVPFLLTISLVIGRMRINLSLTP